MRGFADTDATGVIERLRVTAEQQAEEVTRAAFNGRLATPPRRAVITHAVAANERASITLSVRPPGRSQAHPLSFSFLFFSRAKGVGPFRFPFLIFFLVSPPPPVR